MSELKLPELGENIDRVDVSAVLVAKGDRIRRDQPVIEVETEKASLEVPATEDGLVTELRVKQGDTVSVGQVILLIEYGPTEESAERPGPVTTEQEKPATPPQPEVIVAEPSASIVEFPARAADRPQLGQTVPAAPSVRALARELGIEIRDVPGRGPGGRISRDDVKHYTKQRVQAAGAAGIAPARPAAALPDFTRWGAVESQPLSKIRRVTASNMANSWNTVPHVTQFDRADITQLESMRKKFNTRSEAAAAKLTVTATVTKMSAMALQRYPRFNASLDLAGGAIILKKYVHIGVAVDTERGLLVPVIRDVDRKGLLEVAAELNDLAARSRDKKIHPDELSGASFTISNLGGLGTTYFSPIVNWPEVAILGVGRAEVQAVHIDGAFQPRRILPLSLSYDHRVIDGADAARFLRWVAEALEQPLLLLLQPSES